MLASKTVTTKLTRTDFEKFAQLAKSLKPEQSVESAEYGQWLLTCMGLATVLSGFNDKFDTIRFLDSCE